MAWRTIYDLPWLWNLASPLSAANEFEIIGNVGEFSGFNGFGPSEDFFEQWFNENQNKFNSYLSSC